MAVQVKELDPDNPLADKTVQRLTPIVNERRERMKDEMLGECGYCTLRNSMTIAGHCCSR